MATLVRRKTKAYGGGASLANPSDRMKRGGNRSLEADGGGSSCSRCPLRGGDFVVPRSRLESPGGEWLSLLRQRKSPKKATARGRPSASLALRSVSEPCAKLAPWGRSDTRPAVLRCRPATRRRTRADEPVAVPARAAQGTRRAPSRARLPLVTFLGKTRKVTGRAAL